MQQTFNKYAFISYSHQDEHFAKWLQRKLEAYRLPTGIENEYKKTSYLRPIFRDETDLNTGVLGEELYKNLESSKYLIVLCSPHSTTSQWVDEEVATFIRLGRIDKIIPVCLQEGTDNPTHIYPESLKQHIKSDPKDEILAVSLSDGKQKALIRIISKLLEINYDDLWNRYEREKRLKLLTSIISSPIILALLYYLIVPITLSITINEDKNNLPSPEKALVVFNKAEYPLYTIDTTFLILNIPGYYRGRKVPISFFAKWYQDYEDHVLFSYGLHTKYHIHTQRDSTFAVFAGHIYDDSGLPISLAEVTIGDSTMQTNEEGYFQVVFPINEQSEYKPILIKKSGKKEILRSDECPNRNLKYIMHTK